MDNAGAVSIFRGRPFVIYFLVKDLKAFRTFFIAVSTIAPKCHAPLRFSRMYRTVNRSLPCSIGSQTDFAVLDRCSAPEKLT